jgi:hypothetical protein
VARPSTETCVACHRDGARIGLSFQGLREVTPGTAPSHAVGFELTVYGLPPGALLRDEDGRNGVDETPPDLHFEAGMDCIDCHGAWEVHGDGHLGADRTCVEGATRCEDCHGDREREADLRLARHALSRGLGGEVLLTLRRSGKALVVPQVARTAHNEVDGSDAATRAHADGHMESLDCVACHAGWVPSCYGCHIDHDLRETGRYLTNAALVPGRATTRILASRTDDLVLMWNRRGKLQPSMPAERLFITLRGGDPAGSLLFEDAPRSLPGPSASGRVPSFGQRTVDPHTTRRASPFSRCERCHTQGDGANDAVLDVTHGFGSERVWVEACDVARDGSCGPNAPRTTYALDAVIAPDGVPLVVPGHGASRPLSLEEIDRMRSIAVE